MKIYKVGGYVRDTILGVTPKDTDFVVVGATPEEMIAQGFEKVGASFPVFLKDGCEYALARTERKVGIGYHGFETSYDPSVTLEDDLLRRDLTINSMAMDENGTIIDPYGGRADLASGILRHTSEAFAEDPVRVLRTARFAARYSFCIADATYELMNKIVPELETVPQERIWAEFEKGLMEKYPHLMFIELSTVDAFRTKALGPYYLYHGTQLQRVKPQHDIVTRFALVSSGFEETDYETCRIPNECTTVGRAFNKNFAKLIVYADSWAERRLALLQELRALNDSWLLHRCLEVLSFYNQHAMERTRQQTADDLVALDSIDAAALAATCQNGLEIKTKLQQARLAVLSR